MRRRFMRAALFAALFALLAPAAARAQEAPPARTTTQTFRSSADSPHQSRVTRRADGRIIISDILTRDDGSKRFIVRHYKDGVLLKRVQIDGNKHTDTRRRSDGERFRSTTRVRGKKLDAKSAVDFASREHWLTRQATQSVTKINLGEQRRIVKHKRFDAAGALRSYAVRYQRVENKPTASGQVTRSVFDFQNIADLLTNATPSAVEKIWATKNTAHLYRATFDAAGKVHSSRKATFGGRGNGSLVVGGVKRQLPKTLVLRAHAKIMRKVTPRQRHR